MDSEDYHIAIGDDLLGAAPRGIDGVVFSHQEVSYVTPTSALPAPTMTFEVSASETGLIDLGSFTLQGQLEVTNAAGTAIVGNAAACEDLLDTLFGDLSVQVQNSALEDSLLGTEHPYARFAERALLGGKDELSQDFQTVVAGNETSAGPLTPASIDTALAPITNFFCPAGTPDPLTTQVELRALFLALFGGAVAVNALAATTLPRKVLDALNAIPGLAAVAAGFGAIANPFSQVPSSADPPTAEEMAAAFNAVIGQANAFWGLNLAAHPTPGLSRTLIPFTASTGNFFGVGVSNTSTINHVLDQITYGIQQQIRAFYEYTISSRLTALEFGQTAKSRQYSQELVALAETGTVAVPALAAAGTVLAKVATQIGENGANAIRPATSPSLRARAEWVRGRTGAGARLISFSYKPKGPAFVPNALLPTKTKMSIRFTFQTKSGRLSVADEAATAQFPLRFNISGVPRLYYATKHLTDVSREAYSAAILERPISYSCTRIAVENFTVAPASTVTVSNLLSGMRPSLLCVQIVPDAAWNGHQLLSPLAGGPAARFTSSATQLAVAAPIATPTRIEATWGGRVLYPVLEQIDGQDDQLAMFYERYVAACPNGPSMTWAQFQNYPLFVWDMATVGKYGDTVSDPSDVSSFRISVTTGVVAAAGAAAPTNWSRDQRVVLTAFYPTFWSVNAARAVSKQWS